MTRFPERPDDEFAIITLEDTDRPLPAKINPSTRYAYFKTIAKGGKSVVQSCKDLHLARTICYKKLRPEYADDPIEQTRFVREARVSAMLQHPNTVPTYELGRDSRGLPYFTMKLVHGYTLREVLDYRDRYDLTRLMEVFTQVTYALQHAHEHRVIHRDIKPENILVGPFGEVLVLDWGLAKVWNRDGTADPIVTDGAGSGDARAGDRKPTSITGEGNLEGTAEYMSPEQIRRDPDIDYRTDIYSMGAVLYEILCGRYPGVGETVREITEHTLNTVPEKPSSVTTARIPALLETLAMRCLSKDPDDRVPTCSDLIRHLQENWQASGAARRGD